MLVIIYIYIYLVANYAIMSLRKHAQLRVVELLIEIGTAEFVIKSIIIIVSRGVRSRAYVCSIELDQHHDFKLYLKYKISVCFFFLFNFTFQFFVLVKNRISLLYFSLFYKMAAVGSSGRIINFSQPLPGVYLKIKYFQCL